MFKVLEAAYGVLAVEIYEGYTEQDVKQLKIEFEKAIDDSDGKINLLIKLDRLKLSDIEFKAFLQDSSYALKNKDKMRHIAIVGSSLLEKVLVSLDNFILGKKSQELIEKYFDASKIDEAWAFVRS